MTKEELDKTLKETNDELNQLANSDKPLTREEQSWQGKLQVRKAMLSEIKRAQEKGNKSSEVYYGTLYEMLISWGERRPVLMFFASNILRVRFSSGAFRM